MIAGLMNGAAACEICGRMAGVLSDASARGALTSALLENDMVVCCVIGIEMICLMVL